MPPTETDILTSFLLPSASLPTALPLPTFRALFPRPLRDSPDVAALYRELQHQRAVDADDVRRNIAAEAQRGERLRREVASARRRDEAAEVLGLDAGELQMEAELFGPSTHNPSAPAHTLGTIKPALARARSELEDEVDALEAEATAARARISALVGDLSDLRYGRLKKQAGTEEELGQEVVESLQRLEAACEALDKRQQQQQEEEEEEEAG